MSDPSIGGRLLFLTALVTGLVLVDLDAFLPPILPDGSSENVSLRGILFPIGLVLLLWSEALRGLFLWQTGSLNDDGVVVKKMTPPNPLTL